MSNPTHTTPAAKPVDTRTDSGEVDRAFTALRTYQSGSPRGALVPLDQAVAAAETNAADRKRMEERLLVSLKECPSLVAREYICSKLTRIASETSVPALAALLGDAALGLAARNALEAIPGKPALKALRSSLAKTNGVLRLGIINSLGARRDEDSVRELTRLLSDPDQETSRAALAALGNIGTVKAAKVLRAWMARSPESKSFDQPAADALLTCAEHLTAAGRQSDAQALRRLLLVPGQPQYIQAAAQ